jgi:hypothetical protein
MKTTRNSNYKLQATETTREMNESSLVKPSVILKSTRPQKSMMRAKSFKPKRIISASKVILKKECEL